jgi:hypothetical protein
MKTLTLLICALSLPAFGQQLNNRRVAPIQSPSQIFDAVLHGTVVSITIPPRSAYGFLRIQTDGQLKDFRVPVALELKKNGNLAHADEIAVGDFVGGTTQGNSQIVKSLNLMSPPPPKVVKVRTNAPPASTNASVAQSSAAHPATPQSPQK